MPYPAASLAVKRPSRERQAHFDRTETIHLADPAHGSSCPRDPRPVELVCCAHGQGVRASALRRLFGGWFGNYDMAKGFTGVVFSTDGSKHTSKGSEGYLRFDYGKLMAITNPVPSPSVGR